MGPLDAFGHLINLILPALAVAAAASLGAKLAWRRELAAVSWWRLARVGAGAGIVATLTSLVIFGRDGSMAGYGLLVSSCAISLWWRGFGPGRR